MSTASHALNVIPLGGVGEIGKNMTLIECGEEILVIDAGLEFPDEETPGIDFAIPDFTYLLENRDRVVGVILTHGHEDHIGALPFLLPDLHAPLYGTRLTFGLLEVKLREHPGVELPPLLEVQPGDSLSIGCFDLELIRVNHSIPDGFGLGIHTPAGLIVHSGDFKFDHTPIDGLTTDFGLLARLGDEGVRVLLSDVTNATRPGYTPSERVVAETFHEVFARAPRRIIVSAFASNIHRLQQVFDVAADYGRKVLVSGLSMERVVSIAAARGYLHLPPETLIGLDQLSQWPEEQVVILTTGSQGEPLSVLVRMAMGEHKQLKIHRGDTVIISATPIPGNEATVWRTINRLFEGGADVIYDPLARVHVSGHGSQEDLRLLLDLVRPEYVIPVHGERRHTMAYANIAQEMGLAPDRIFLLENGDVLEVGPEGATVAGQVPAGRVLVQGRRVGYVAQPVVEERHRLAESGILVLILAVDPRTGELVHEPELVGRGFVWPTLKPAAELLAALRERVRARFHELPLEERRQPETVAQHLRRSLTQLISSRTNSRPLLEIVWVEARGDAKEVNEMETGGGEERVTK